MDVDNRRTKLEELLKSSREPLTGTELAFLIVETTQSRLRCLRLL